MEAEKTLKAPVYNTGDDEKNNLAQMRLLVEAKDPAAKEVDNLMLRRFLRARNQDVEKASAMFLKYLNWRRTAVPNGYISEADIKDELAQKKACVQGFDKAGHPIGIIFPARHFYAKRDMDAFKSLCIYVLDKACARIPSGQEKFIGIVDLQGWGYSNCDIWAYAAGLDIMQNCYPERLGKAFVINVPYLFMKAWKMIYPFIDENTRKKIVFVDNKNLKATLLEDIDESQLPEIYGGKLPLIPV
ncbi:random slug protein 5-like [Canna indica]|uniref:Random slug protein 5-like n=1 Tax=Canna indica TaxID=4628 RepID=A0AAQ3KDL2_9LILI|nr:random slug protein 5-like [Canna indica]